MQGIDYSHEQDTIDTAVQLWIIGNLTVLAPNNLTGLSDETQFRDIDLENCTLGNNTELCVA